MKEAIIPIENYKEKSDDDQLDLLKSQRMTQRKFRQKW